MRFLFRCPACRTRRRDWNLMKRHQADHQHHFCHCYGYSFKHRPGSPYCHHNPLSPIRQVARDYGEDLRTIMGLARGIIRDRPELAERVEQLMTRLGFEFTTN